MTLLLAVLSTNDIAAQPTHGVRPIATSWSSNPPLSTDTDMVRDDPRRSMESPAPGHQRVDWATSVDVRGSTLDRGAALASRLRLASDLQLGASLGGAVLGTYYVAGYPRRPGNALDASAWALLPVGETGPALFTFGGSLRGRRVWLTETTPEGSNATRVSLELSWLGHVTIAAYHVLRWGPVLLLDWETAPTFTPASLGQLAHFGHAVSLGERLALSTRVEAGGTFGFDGDNEKFLLRGGIELLARFGEGGESWLVF